MPNITSDFHALIQASQQEKHPTQEKTSLKDKKEYDIFTKEAYRIYQHIDSLTRFLLSIRRAYLSNDSRKSRYTNTNLKNSDNATTNSLFAMFPTNITHLTDRERDEIDFQAKLIIRRCMDRVKELEEAERLRKEQAEAKASRRLANFLQQVIPGVPSSMVDIEDIIGIHRSNMVWLLNKLLMDVSKLQKGQQETRLTRELEKSENHLFNNNTMLTTSNQSTIETSSSSSGLGLNWKATKSTITKDTSSSGEWAMTDIHEDMDAFEQQLSQEQIQMLEKENEAMLEEMNSTLNQVHQAEKALMEISTLQSQLTNHLAVQTMQTDRLYGDSLATTERVEQGNLQLQQARERNRGTRKFMLIFLFGASLVLLFLDWYS
ncbi:uncharacterized protein BX664DRAFT_343518 [Halteromyces radiatus]|uniref:uncharacterized protein n=1 Tax=Halteromyces radiatus TaxID=101107 RepID=UPI0022205C74|nr:uncharacterized protein BX664DRAFT_343518 [Halteromyces radiatus]KAI8077802.1 hypothetical protein BX664DRAFT_343518 [Halteromyces radiatus]